jgi:hypothetical protein
MTLDSPYKLKAFFHRNMPSIKYGTEHTIVKAVTVSANTDAAAQMVNLSRAVKAAGRPSGTEASETVPFEVMPGQLTMETIGCPFFQHGQQFFFDYQTNTTIDNIYIVKNLEHKLDPNSYTTSVGLHMVGFYGTFEGLGTKLTEAQQAIAAYSEANPEPIDPEDAPDPGTA